MEDSPDSAGIAADAIRCAKLAMDRGLSGAIEEASLFFFKHPPRQIPDAEAKEKLEQFISGEAEKKPLVKAMLVEPIARKGWL